MRTKIASVGLLTCGLFTIVGADAVAQSGGIRIERLAPGVRAEWLNRYQDSRLGPEQTEKFSKTIKTGRGSTLDLQNVSGSITVTGASGDNIVIDAIKRVRARDDARAKAMLMALEIRLDERPGRVTVRTIYPRAMTTTLAAVDYTVRVPQDAAVDLTSISGDLRVTNVNGELRLETVNGSVRAGQSPRLGFAKSVSGNVEITGNIEVELNASSLTGALLLQDVRARALELTTISGDVVLNSVLVDRALRVRSVNGDLRFEGPLSKSGRYDMNSHSGRIQMLLPPTSGFEIDASTFSGNLRSELPLTITGTTPPSPPPPPNVRTPPVPPAPPTPPRRPEENRARVQVRERGRAGQSQTIRGTFGDASAYVVIHTFSGDIVIGRAVVAKQ
jgi:DUF4097 and DUF4098 domain-containing protein YvlB